MREPPVLGIAAVEDLDIAVRAPYMPYIIGGAPCLPLPDWNFASTRIRSA